MPKNIKIYTTPTCAYCFALKRFLQENNISFEEVDVASNDKAREEMLKKTNQLEVPVIEIDGEILVGFNKEKIKELLNIK
jgi:glutaredoxin-like YruB-family protein